LSGGWDSRLIGALAAKRSRRPLLAWTTSIDDGLDHDLTLAGPVAAALGAKHRVYVQDADAYRTEREPVFERVQHQTYMHTASCRSPACSPGGGSRCWTDWPATPCCAGTTTATIEATSPDAQREALWTLIAIGDGRLVEDWFAPGVAARLIEASRESFAAATRAFDGHPSAPRLGWLATRAGGRPRRRRFASSRPRPMSGCRSCIRM
jgi:hypothetical protein